MKCSVWSSLGFAPRKSTCRFSGSRLFTFVLNVLTAGLTGVVMANVSNSSTGVILAVALNQSAGAILGIVLAIALLKLGLVDCENWDLFAVLEGRQGQSKKKARKGKLARRFVSAGYAPEPRPKARSSRKEKGTARLVKSIVDPSTKALRTFRQHLDLGEIEAALAVYQKRSRSRPDWQLSEADCRDLAEALLEQHAWDDAVAVMRDHVRSAFEPSARIRLKLAQILIQKLSRPLQALKFLDEIPEGTLPESLEAIRRELVREATAIQEDEDGPLELQDEVW